MALPFYVRAQPFNTLASTDIIQLAFGPFPLNDRLLIRSYRIHLSFDDPTLACAVSLFAAVSAKPIPAGVGLANYRALFASANANSSLSLLNVPSLPNGFLTLDIPCYVIPTNEELIHTFLVENLSADAINGYIAPVLDFNYRFEYDDILKP